MRERESVCRWGWADESKDVTEESRGGRELSLDVAISGQAKVLGRCLLRIRMVEELSDMEWVPLVV